MRTTPVIRLLAVFLALGLVAGACGGDDDSGDTDDPGTDTATGDGPTIRVRGQDFSESATIAEVYGQFLEARGYPVEILAPAGFRTEVVAALEAGEVDLIIDYIGGSQAELRPDEPPSQDADEVVGVITPAYAEIGATVLEVSPAVDGDAFVVRGDSEATTISDVAGLDYRLGASAQCYERPQCFLGFSDPEIYGIEFSETRTIEFGPLLGEALAQNEVDAVVWNTTAPEIDANGFKVLDDDQGVFPAQNIAPIIRTEVLDAWGEGLAEALDELSAMITTQDLLDWNTETDLEFREPDDVAREWLEAEGLL